jgi:hypothetical protein
MQRDKRRPRATADVVLLSYRYVLQESDVVGCRESAACERQECPSTDVGIEETTLKPEGSGTKSV